MYIYIYMTIYKEKKLEALILDIREESTRRPGGGINVECI